MKIVVALMQHETNTFSSLPTPYEAFAGATGLSYPPSGNEAAAAYGNADIAFAAFLELGKTEGAEICPRYRYLAVFIDYVCRLYRNAI